MSHIVSLPNEDRGGNAPAIKSLPRKGVRIQRSRKRGYRTPPDVIYVGRPTLWGNPFDARRFGHIASVKLYRHWIDGELGARFLERLRFSPAEIDALTRWRSRLLPRLPELAGKTLQCWCPLNAPACHADVLIEKAILYAEYDRYAL